MDADTDPPPSRWRLTPLTAALLIPALALAVGASLWLGSHARGDRSPTAVATSNPNSIVTLTPWLLAWPAEDGGTVDRSEAYGVLAIQAPAGPGPRYTATLDPAAAAPPSGGTARQGAVQRTFPLDDSTVGAVAERVGTTHATMVQGMRSSWPDIGLEYDASTSTFTWQPAAAEAVLPAVPRDSDSAAAAARTWLLQRGLIAPLAPVVATQVSHGDLAAFPTWQVIVPHGGGESAVTEIAMTVSASGRFSELTIVHPLVAETSAYPLVDWPAAWAQVQAGRARDVSNAAGAGTATLTVHVDAVRLTARLVQTTTGSDVVPAWSFTDTASHTTLYWPALDPSTYTLP